MLLALVILARVSWSADPARVSKPMSPISLKRLTEAHSLRRATSPAFGVPQPPAREQPMSGLIQPSWLFHEFDINEWRVANLTDAVCAAKSVGSLAVFASNVPIRQSGLHFISFLDFETCDSDNEPCWRLFQAMWRFLAIANERRADVAQWIILPVHDTVEKWERFISSFPETETRHIRILDRASSRTELAAASPAINQVFLLDWQGDGGLPPRSVGYPDKRKICVRDPIRHLTDCHKISDLGTYAVCVEERISFFRERCNFLYPEIRDILFEKRQLEEATNRRRAARESGHSSSAESSPNIVGQQPPSAGQLPPTLVLPTTMTTTSHPSTSRPACSSCVRFLSDAIGLVRGLCSPGGANLTYIDTTLARLMRAIVGRTGAVGDASTFQSSLSRNYCYFLSPFFDRLKQLAVKGSLQTDSTKHSNYLFEIAVSYHVGTRLFLRDTFPPSSNDLKQFIRENLNPESPYFRVFVAPHGSDGEDKLTYGELFYEDFSEIAEPLFTRCDSRRRCLIRLVVIDCYSFGAEFSPLPDTRAALDDIQRLADVLKIRQDISVLQGAYPAIQVMRSIEIEEFQRSILERIPVTELHDRAIQRIRASQKLVTVGISVVQSKYEEEFLKTVIDWFSEEFFSWVPNPIMCQMEGCTGAMEFRNAGVIPDPDAPEDLHASLKPVICENHYCRTCGDALSYIRPLTDAMKILENRMGRCGEFAKAFAMVIRSLGYPVRLVMGKFIDPNSDGFGIFYFKKKGPPDGAAEEEEDDQRPLDHMWNEVYLRSRQAWVHVDTSVGEFSNMKIFDKRKRFDSPLIYDDPDYPIKLTAVVAAETNRIAVITPKYLSGYVSLQRAEEKEGDQRIKLGARQLSALMSGEEIRGFLHPDQFERAEDQMIHKRFPLDPLVGISLRDFGLAMGNLRILGHPIQGYRSKELDQLFSSYYTLMSLKNVPDWWVSKVIVCRTPILEDQGASVFAVDEISFEYSSVQGEEEQVIRKFSTKPINDFSWLWKAPRIESERVCVTKSISRDDYIVNIVTTTQLVGGTHVLADAKVILSSEVEEGGVAPSEVPTMVRRRSLSLAESDSAHSRHRRASSEGGTLAPSAAPITARAIPEAEAGAPKKMTSKIVGIYGSRENGRGDPFEFVGLYALDILEK